jgi:hypothetical protein
MYCHIVIAPDNNRRYIPCSSQVHTQGTDFKTATFKGDCEMHFGADVNVLYLSHKVLNKATVLAVQGLYR